jgi:hypothetical protein
MSNNTGESSKRPKNGDLPSDIDFKTWHQVFVPTFIQWVSQQVNPFKHNAKLACETMQIIWDTISVNVPYMIIQSSPVYTLVGVYFYYFYFPSFHITDCTTYLLILGTTLMAQQELLLFLLTTI